MTAVLLSSALVGAVVYFSLAGVLHSQIEQRFRDLASEHQKQVQTYVRVQSQAVTQITSRTRLRQIITSQLTAPRLPQGADEAELAARILGDAVEATPSFQQIDVVDRGDVVIASSDATRINRVSESASDIPDRLDEPTMIVGFANGKLADTAVIAAPMLREGRRSQATTLVTFDTQPLQEILGDTDRLGYSGRTLITDFQSQEHYPIELGNQFRPTERRGFDTISSDAGTHLVYWEPLRFSPNHSHSAFFVATLSADEAFESLASVRAMLLLVVILVSVINGGLAYFAARRTEQRLHEVADAAFDVGTSEFSGVVTVPNEHPYGFLAHAINDMGERVNATVTQLKEDAERERDEHVRLNAEIEIARQIQTCLYPSDRVCTESFEITGKSVAAEVLCGDYFDYFANEHEIIFAIGDVSGHGIGPALLMVEVRGVIRGLQWNEMSLEETVARLNELLVTGSPDSRFVTLMVGRVNRATGAVEYVGAGHRAFIARADGSIEELPSTGMVLGLIRQPRHYVAHAGLNEGDILFATSDGIEETLSTEGVLFGRQRVTDTVSELRDQPLDSVLNTIFSRAREHGGQSRSGDDCTALMMRRVAKEPLAAVITPGDTAFELNVRSLQGDTPSTTTVRRAAR